MDTNFNDIVLSEGYKGNMITKDLPKELDNTLFTLIHVLGGFDSSDVISFARNANYRERRLLTKMVDELNLYEKPFDREGIINSSRYRALTVFIKVIGDSSNINEDYTISRELPEDLDNQLYFLSHYIGGFTTSDVGRFSKYITPRKIKTLRRLLNRVPSDQYELIPLAGMYKSIYESPDYQKLISLILGTLTEDVDVNIDGHSPTDTNPYFTRYVKPELKKQIFGYWDKHGLCYDCLKYFNVIGEDKPFDNVADVVYPVLALEWLGGVEFSEFAKQGWETTSEMGFDKLKFKVEPVSFDYLFDETENFGERGYSCWDIRVVIDINGYASLDDSDRLKKLFPESAQNKLSSYSNYTNEQMELIEDLWDYYLDVASEYFGSFCRVEVVLV